MLDSFYRRCLRVGMLCSPAFLAACVGGVDSDLDTELYAKHDQITYQWNEEYPLDNQLRHATVELVAEYRESASSGWTAQILGRSTGGQDRFLRFALPDALDSRVYGNVCLLMRAAGRTLLPVRTTDGDGRDTARFLYSDWSERVAYLSNKQWEANSADTELGRLDIAASQADGKEKEQRNTLQAHMTDMHRKELAPLGNIDDGIGWCQSIKASTVDASGRLNFTAKQITEEAVKQCVSRSNSTMAADKKFTLYTLSQNTNILSASSDASYIQQLSEYKTHVDFAGPYVVSDSYEFVVTTDEYLPLNGEAFTLLGAIYAGQVQPDQRALRLLLTANLDAYFGCVRDVSRLITTEVKASSRESQLEPSRSQARAADRRKYCEALFTRHTEAVQQRDATADALQQYKDAAGVEDNGPKSLSNSRERLNMDECSLH